MGLQQEVENSEVGKNLRVELKRNGQAISFAVKAGAILPPKLIPTNDYSSGKIR